MSGLLPHVQCGYTETSIVYACPHWPSASNDPRHHMATRYNEIEIKCLRLNIYLDKGYYLPNDRLVI